MNEYNGKEKEMKRMIWWLDFLSVVMLVVAGGWMIARIADAISMTSLVPIQTIAIAAFALTTWNSHIDEKSRDDKTLR